MQVKPGSLADKAGKIKVGDELLQVNTHVHMYMYTVYKYII